MSSPAPSRQPHLDEPKRWLDQPENIKRGLRGFYAICVLLILVDPFLRQHAQQPEPPAHAEHPWEWLFGFYGGYGFVACVLLVLAATQMRKVVMRDEDYYD